MKPFYPTAIESQRRCPRRRAGRYLFRVKPLRERDWSRSLGDEVHELYNRWIKLGQAPVPDRTVADNVFIAGLPYLPAPRQGASENEARITLNGITYAMQRDWKGTLLELPGGATQGHLTTYGDMPAQLDLKTSSQPLKYGLWTRDQFLDDTQALLGALELAENANGGQGAPGAGADVVASRWLYFQTPSKDKEGNYRLRGKVEAFPSDMILGRDALGRAHLKLIEPAARAMAEQDEAFAAGQRGDPRGLTDFRQLPFNPLACDDYKGRQAYGCDFVPFCTGHMPAHLNLADPGRLAQAGYAAPSAPLPAPSQLLGAAAPVGENRDMSSLFNQFQNGQAPAPALGAPPAPAFAPPPMVAAAVMPGAHGSAAQGFIRNPNGSYSQVMQGVVVPPFAPEPFANTGAPVPQSMTAPVFAPIAPSSTPVVPSFAPPVAAPPFQGFVGVNAPEIRAMDQNPFAAAAEEKLRAVKEEAYLAQIAKEGTAPSRPGLPSEADALAALKVLRAFLNPF